MPQAGSFFSRRFYLLAAVCWAFLGATSVVGVTTFSEWGWPRLVSAFGVVFDFGLAALFLILWYRKRPAR